MDAESGAFSDRGIEVDGAKMVFDDLITDRKPEARTFADFLRRKERLEYPCSIGFLDATTGIMHGDTDTVGCFVIAGGYVEVAAGGHAIGSIVRKIENHLRNFVLIHTS